MEMPFRRGGIMKKLSFLAEEKKCPICGTLFKRANKAIYCSYYCKEQAKRNRKQKKERLPRHGMNPLKEYECQVCGNKIYSKRFRTTCSDTCRMIHIRKKSYTRIKHKEGKSIKCIECGNLFITNREVQKFCSKKCSDNYRKRLIEKSKEDGTYFYENSHFLRLRFEIFKRDNFTCQYCGRNVKDDKVKLHLEHIVPKSNGGESEIDNYTTSCFECNIGKGDVLLEKRILNKKERGTQ